MWKNIPRNEIGKMQKILVGLIIVLSVSQVYAQESADTEDETVNQESQIVGEEQNVAEEPTKDPCEGITCANHGQCALKSGNPVCACNEGYEADPTTGLSCRPIQASVQPIPEKEITEQEQVETALGARKGALNRKYQNFLKSGGQSFANYMYGYSTRRRNAGIAVLSIGLAFMGGAITLGVWTGTNQPSTCDSDDPDDAEPCAEWMVGKILGTGVLAFFGVGGTVVGAILTAKGNKGRKRLKPLLTDEKSSANNGAIRFAGLRPLFSSKNTLSGAALQFQF